MESTKNTKQGQRTVTVAAPCTRTVAERRLLWLLRQHPHMSRDICRRWAFGAGRPYAPIGTEYSRADADSPLVN
jgi:hypothetical protein